MGLALACATAFLLTDGMKNLFGKPRPHLLAVCQPDYANANNYVLGGYDNGINDGRLYSWTICTQTDSSLLNDAFVSFPSGHSSCISSCLHKFVDNLLTPN
jgi:membrane-associated phospholipid phosphatase